LVHNISNRNSINLFECDPITIPGGGQAHFFFSVFNMDSFGNITDPIALDDIIDIEWLVSPYSMIAARRVAVIHKRETYGDIFVLEDGSDGNPNRIQVNLDGELTSGLNGAFLHQLIITDGAGNQHVALQGIINIKPRIQSA